LRKKLPLNDRLWPKAAPHFADIDDD